ncbi:uncharacterized protein [Blastocystis hominis]|uniref:Uncharacterized protein n=1 Tax=Blastocystis hominis TaxID=12968 RepID=D8M0F9_BLAHO|nr:uncharacterized protein [Blastocystis hominis]CBK21548.2 unnamed protein product [Blastocystis hominis]|eukprot:XP_012895596.1 uncharacterized protein [Blastocystis hominis]
MEGSVAYAACEEGYTGYRFALCRDGQYVNENTTNCVIHHVSVLSYGISAVVLVLNASVSGIFPKANGALSDFSVNPLLPTGMSFSSANGTISGTPTVESEVKEYTIHAHDGDNELTTTLNISVVALPCPALGSFSGVASGEISTSTSACPEDYEGTSTRLCTNGVFGPLNTDQCHLIAPSSLQYAPSEINCLRHESVSLVPTWDHVVSSWSISPQLPSGLALTAKGLIVGVAEEVQAETFYTVTAENSYGSTTATIKITISAAPCSGRIGPSGSLVTIEDGEYFYEECSALPPEDFMYPVSTYTLNQNETISSGKPHYRNRITSFEISPSLPTGIVFNSMTGEITGSSSELLTATEFFITGRNEDSSAVTSISLSIHLPYCQKTAEFESVPVGQSQSINCTKSGYYGMANRNGLFPIRIVSQRQCILSCILWQPFLLSVC